MTTVDEITLRRYLLGQLSEEDLNSLEDVLFSEDDNLLNELALVEDDLIDEYVLGQLPTSEIEPFESHFLTSPRKNERVRVARFLLNRAKSADAPPSPRKVWSLTPRPSKSWLGLMAASILIAVGLTGFVALRLRDNRDQQVAARDGQIAQLERELRGVQERLSQQARPETVAKGTRLNMLAFFLSPDIAVRSAKQGEQRAVAVVGIPAVPEPVELNLDVSAGAEQRFRSYRAVLQTAAGNDVWNTGGLSTMDIDGDIVIRVNVPAGVLKRGSYRMKLYGATASGAVEEIDDYSFRVLPR